MELSDELLCDHVKNGVRLCEDILAERYLKLVRICARPYFLAGGTSEDITQEGMLGLLGAIRDFEPGRHASFRIFAERCIKNRIYSGMRAANREKHIPLNRYVPIDPLSSDDQIGLDRFSAQAPDPEQSLLDRESYDELFLRLRQQLSALESTVLEFFLEGLSIAEIAERCARPQKSIENAVSRVRKKLAHQLQSGDSRR